MRPHFTLVGGSEVADGALFLPPLGFAPLEGKVVPGRMFRGSGGPEPSSVETGALVRSLEGKPELGLGVASTRASVNSGHLFEARVLGQLGRIFGSRLWPKPRVEFQINARSRLCLPDALLFFPDHLVILETKLTHTVGSWWQLRQLYSPVLSAFVAPREVRVVEIPKLFSSSIPFPEPVELLTSLSQLKVLDQDHFFVLPWTKEMEEMEAEPEEDSQATLEEVL